MISSGRIFCLTKDKYTDWEIPGEEIIEVFFARQYSLTESNWKESVCLQTNYYLYERRDEKWIKINYKNLFEYSIIRYQMIYKTIYVKNSEMFSIEFYLC